MRGDERPADSEEGPEDELIKEAPEAKRTRINDDNREGGGDSDGETMFARDSEEEEAEEGRDEEGEEAIPQPNEKRARLSGLL